MVPPATVGAANLRSAQPAAPFAPYPYPLVNPMMQANPMVQQFAAPFSNLPYVGTFASPSVPWSPRGAAKGVVPEAQRPLSEKEAKELKRKKANRESARRSKLRKKEEFESLAKKVEELSQKGLALRTEIAKMEGVLETLTSQNQSLRKEVLAAHGSLECLKDLEDEAKDDASGKGKSGSSLVAPEGKKGEGESGNSQSTATDLTSSDCTNQIRATTQQKDLERDTRRSDSGGESDEMNCTVRIK